ncbi:MAG: helix-turn-helix transcriptional regulator [Synergistaceae bacterium]|nr:helix-turn-helix transcriptional regulator [Synergistaceae bacterium]
MNIKQLRKLQGITQEELSIQMGVHENTIRMWEKGTRSPRVSDIAKLCKIFHCTESELLNGPSSDKVEIVLSWDWQDMKKGEINMNENKFKLILGDDGMIGLNGAGLITSHEAIEEFLCRIRKELEIALDAQVRRGVIPEA